MADIGWAWQHVTGGPRAQFTSADFTSVLIDAGVRISIDGRGRWMDNVFIERVWRSLKYEDVYLRGYADGREAKAGIGAYFAFYNEQRLHQALGYRTPRAVLRDGGGAGSLWTCGQRIRVDHRPTGRSETAADRTLGGLIKDNQQTASNLTAAKNGPACAGPLQSEIIERCHPRHGSAFRDWAGNETPFAREIAEAALAHVIGDAAERAYRRGDALEKRRAMMEAWAQWCEPKAANVLAFAKPGGGTT